MTTRERTDTQARLPLGETAKRPESTYLAQNLITFSQLERIIYRQVSQPELTSVFEPQTVIGSAVDYFLVLTNFIYRYRGGYCARPDDPKNPGFSDNKVADVFSQFYPTGWQKEKMLDLLLKHRSRFFMFAGKTDFKPEKLVFTKTGIRQALIPLWEKVARKFSLDTLQMQNVMVLEDQSLLSSEKAASSESPSQIATRIISERFDALVDDDKDYSYIAKPDCLLAYNLNGETFHIQVQPDYIKRLREERKTTKARHIVAKTIIGDFKDSKRQILDRTTAYGQAMHLYNWLLSQTGQRFKQNQLQWVRLANRQQRKVFLIPQDVTRPIESGQVQTALEFLQEAEGSVFTPMPILTDQDSRLAQEILEQSLKISRTVKI